MHKISISIFVIMSLFVISCSSTRKSIALGLASGAVTGAAIGSTISDNNGRGAISGLAIGAVVGGIASYFIDMGLQERDKETRRDTLFNLEKHGVFGLPSSDDQNQLKSVDTQNPWPMREASGSWR